MDIGQWFNKQMCPLTNGIRPTQKTLLGIRKAITDMPPNCLMPVSSWVEVAMEWMRLDGLIKDYTPEDER